MFVILIFLLVNVMVVHVEVWFWWFLRNLNTQKQVCFCQKAHLQVMIQKAKPLRGQDPKDKLICLGEH